MDPQLRQRLVGAAVLVSLAVLIIPAFLDQDRPRPSPVVARDMAPMPIYEFPDSPAVIDDGDEADISQGLVAPAIDEIPLEPESVPGESVPPAAAGTEPLPRPEAPAAVQVPAPQAATTPEAGVGGDWIIQLGSFSSVANADSLRARLLVEGFEAFVSPLQGAGYTSYRVRVKAPGSRADAETVAARLKQALGYAGIILRDE